MCRLLIGRSSGVLRQPAGTAEALAIPAAVDTERSGL